MRLLVAQGGAAGVRDEVLETAAAAPQTLRMPWELLTIAVAAGGLDHEKTTDPVRPRGASTCEKSIGQRKPPPVPGDHIATIGE